MEPCARIVKRDTIQLKTFKKMLSDANRVSFPVQSALVIKSARSVLMVLVYRMVNV